VYNKENRAIVKQKNLALPQNLGVMDNESSTVPHFQTVIV